MKLWKQGILSMTIISVAAIVSLQIDDVRNAIGLTVEGQENTTRERQSRNRSVPVIVAKVTTGENAVYFDAVGTGRAQRSIMLTSEDTGKIVEMALASGTLFEEGDILMRLDDKEQRLAVDLARTRKSQSDRVLQRFEALRQSGNTAIAQLDEVRLAADIARIELDQALEALENRVLRAPFTGHSGLPLVEQGSRVDTETDIASFDDRTVLLVEFDLPEALVSRVSLDMSVKASTPSSPNITYSGKVVALDSRITATSRTAKARVEIENTADDLRPGASFTINIALSGKTYPLVPELAVQFSKGALNVWRVRNGIAERVEVNMVQRRDGLVLVDGPLAQNDLVVVEGTQRLNDNKPVTILQETDAIKLSEPAS